METMSPKNSINKVDLKNLIVLSVKGGVAYALTYFGSHLGGIDLGENAGIIVAVLTVAIDAAVKFLNGPKKE